MLPNEDGAHGVAKSTEANDESESAVLNFGDVMSASVRKALAHGNSPHFDCEQVFTALRAHRPNKARLDHVKGVRAHLPPAAAAPESVAGQPQFKMRSAGVARCPRRFARRFSALPYAAMCGFVLIHRRSHQAPHHRATTTMSSPSFIFARASLYGPA